MPKINKSAAKKASPAPDTEPLLIRLGERIRNLRAIRGMSRKTLADHAGVSQRFLADLESGVGNASILLLNRLADALARPLSEIVSGDNDARTNLHPAVQLLSRLNAADLEEVGRWVQTRFVHKADEHSRSTRIALIGLRGAGKSTLGKRLASVLQGRFVELDQTIEELSGMDSKQIHSMLGQSAYRRYEFEALRSLVGSNSSKIVVATPGSIVSEPETYRFLLANFLSVWIQASPEEHMARVIAQGDMRPMAGNRDAMTDLRRILSTREPLYARADITVSTSDRTIKAALEELIVSLPKSE